MTVCEFASLYQLNCLSHGKDQLIEGGFCGDLLSWVMTNAQRGHVWFTVMGNINAVAVASLNEVACIVLCQGSILSSDALKKAQEEEIWVLSTPLSAFELAGKLYHALL